MIHIFKSNLSDKEKEKMLPIIDYLKVNDTIFFGTLFETLLERFWNIEDSKTEDILK